MKENEQKDLPEGQVFQLVKKLSKHPHFLYNEENGGMVDPSVVFIDGTHIKASANKKKFQKERVAQTAKIYSEQLRQEVNAEREKLAKDPIEDEDDDDTPKGGTKEQTVSTTSALYQIQRKERPIQALGVYI